VLNKHSMRVSQEIMQSNRRQHRASHVVTAIVVVCLASVAAALVSQHVFDMQPCPWCVLQRAIFVAIALVGAVAMLWRSRAGRIVTGGMIILLGLAGAASAAWQHFVAAKSTSCNLTLADKIVSRYLKLDSLLPAVFEVRATCADAAIDLFGIPFEFWSLALFAGIAVSAALYIGAARN
jgi:disulfide bond formation protein DsbB